jgi:hypothetical protein
MTGIHFLSRPAREPSATLAATTGTINAVKSSKCYSIRRGIVRLLQGHPAGVQMETLPG